MNNENQNSRQPEEIRFKKVIEDWPRLSKYEVFREGNSIGFVWSEEELSYRGREGWNRGIRTQDFHPTRWRYGKTLGLAASRFSEYTRRGAVARLAEEANNP